MIAYHGSRYVWICLFLILEFSSFDKISNLKTLFNSNQMPLAIKMTLRTLVRFDAVLPNKATHKSVLKI